MLGSEAARAACRQAAEGGQDGSSCAMRGEIIQPLWRAGFAGGGEGEPTARTWGGAGGEGAGGLLVRLKYASDAAKLRP